MTYPYQRLVLPCGCHEVVTAPGCVDEYTCPEHPGSRDGGSTALCDARLEAFVFRLPEAAVPIQETKGKMPPVAWHCHQALLEMMGSLHDAQLLGELMTLRGAVQAAIATVAGKIQAEYPGALV